MHRVSLSLALTLFTLACVPMDKGYDDSGDDAPTVWFEGATVTCDPYASSWDDVFLFEAWTGGDVDEVDVKIKDGGDTIETVDLDEEDDDYWALEAWADDIGSDCDAFYQLRFIFTATGEDGSEAEAEAAG